MLIQLLKEKQPLAEVRMGSEYIEAFIPRENLHDFMVMIKNDSNLAFDYLFCLTGVDYSDHLQVIYHLESTSLNHILVVKVKTENRETAEVDTVSDIWPTAESHENEVYDLLGIKFNNHPELRRLFLDEGWGFPLRKDFQDDVHVVVR